MRFTSRLVAVVLSAGLAGPAAAEVPKGWFPAGSHPDQYEMGVDSSTRYQGRASAYIKAKPAVGEGFGTLMQDADPSGFRGKRVRFSGMVKSEGVSGWASLWFRIDGAKRENLGFDNMQNRAIKGTNDWRKCEIVLDVPEEAANMAFGMILTGDGRVWMDDLHFDVVSKDVPLTSMISGKSAAPANLDFEQ